MHIFRYSDGLHVLPSASEPTFPIKGRLAFLIWVFIAFGILFNPIAPIRFKRHTWEIIDVATGILAIAPLIVFLRVKEIEKSRNTEKQL